MTDQTKVIGSPMLDIPSIQDLKPYSLILAIVLHLLGMASRGNDRNTEA